jgi:hypothetical protein
VSPSESLRFMLELLADRLRLKMFRPPPSPSWSTIHKRTISSRFLGIILRVLRLEVSLQPVSTHFFQRKGGRRYSPLVEVTVTSKEENSSDFCPNYVQEFSLSKFKLFSFFIVKYYRFLNPEFFYSWLLTMLSVGRVSVLTKNINFSVTMISKCEHSE